MDEEYKEKIIEMLEEITNISDLEMIYGFVKSAYNDIKKEE